MLSNHSCKLHTYQQIRKQTYTIVGNIEVFVFICVSFFVPVLSFQFESVMSPKKRPAAATGTPTKRPTDGEVGEEGTKEKVDTPEVAEAEALAEEVLEEKPEEPDSEKKERQQEEQRRKAGKEGQRKAQRESQDEGQGQR